jgi:hypothetical protein
MNPQLSAPAIKEIRNRTFQFEEQFMDNNLFSSPIKLLTDYRHRAYELHVTPLGSFGERVRSRLTRGGSCFINTHHSDPDQHISRTTHPRALFKIHYYQESAIAYPAQRRND